MALFHSALNSGSSLSMTIGLMVIESLAGIFPLTSALLREVRWDFARSSVDSYNLLFKGHTPGAIIVYNAPL